MEEAPIPSFFRADRFLLRLEPARAARISLSFSLASEEGGGGWRLESMSAETAIPQSPLLLSALHLLCHAKVRRGGGGEGEGISPFQSASDGERTKEFSSSPSLATSPFERGKRRRRRRGGCEYGKLECVRGEEKKPLTRSSVVRIPGSQCALFSLPLFHRPDPCRHLPPPPPSPWVRSHSARD